METILITGGSGLIGKHLQTVLSGKGFDVQILSSKRSKNNYYWNIEIGEINTEAIEKADHIIHLAGANIGEKRWTKQQKQLILESRIKSAKLLFDTIQKCEHKPKTFISASAIGYYGAVTSEHIFSETDEPANDFLGSVGIKWEQAANSFQDLGLRVVKLRTSVVLTKKGGVLEKLANPTRFCFGTSLGSGKQYFPWIHIDDLCEMYLKAISDKSMTGSYNAVAPQHCTNKYFTKAVAKALHKPLFLPAIPTFVLRLAFGEMANLLLQGSRVSSQKIIDAGFQFQFPKLDLALNDLLKE
jgi:uncharacterized protein